MPKEKSGSSKNDAASQEPAQQELAELQDLSYEQARDELIAVVARLEAGGEPLESALKLWERGELLAQHCQNWLDGAQARLDQVRAQNHIAADEE